MDLRLLPDGQLHGQRVGALHGHRDHGECRPGVLSGPLGDQREDLSALAAGHQAVGDLGVRLQPALTQPGLLVQPGIVDRHTGRYGESRQYRLVVLVELGPTALLGQVQVAEDLIAHPDRDAKEGVHRRMVGREAVRSGVIGDFREPQGLGAADQLPEDAVPSG